MARLPAKSIGNFEVLLERLQAGDADKWDQRWAAELLLLAKVPALAAGGKMQRWQREFGIYLEVRALLDKGADLKATYESVAAKHQTLGRDEHAGGDRKPLTWRGVQTIYLAQKKRSAELDLWRDSQPPE